MGTYQKALEAVETEMQGAVDALYKTYLGELEANRRFLPDVKAERDAKAAREYREASQVAKEQALEKEGPLFEDLRRDVEKALTAAPTPEQLAYLQTLSLRPSLTDEDIRTAAVAVAGNAAAEANVAALAARQGVASAKVAAPPSLTELLARIGEYEAFRRNRVMSYRTVQQDGQESEGGTLGFIPGGGWSRAMADAEGALERYGAE